MSILHKPNDGEPCAMPGVRRHPDDQSRTPAWCVHRLLERVAFPAGEWLDPSAGDGDIIRAVDAIRSDVVWSAIEEDAACERWLARCVDARRRIASYLACPPAPWRYHVIMTRPRVGGAQDLLQKALAEAHHVAVLLPLDHLASRECVVFFQSNPPDVYVLPDHFTTAGERGEVAIAWFVWGTERHRPYGHLHVLAETPRAERTREG